MFKGYSDYDVNIIEGALFCLPQLPTMVLITQTVQTHPMQLLKCIRISWLSKDSQCGLHGLRRKGKVPTGMKRQLGSAEI